MNSHKANLLDTHSNWWFIYDVKNISPLVIRIDNSQHVNPVHGCAASHSHGAGDVGWQWHWSKDPQGSLFGSSFLTLWMPVAPGTLYRASTHCVLMIKLSWTLKADSEIPDSTPEFFPTHSLTGPKQKSSHRQQCYLFSDPNGFTESQVSYVEQIQVVSITSVCEHSPDMCSLLLIPVLPFQSHCKPFLGQGQCLTPLLVSI